MKALAEDKRAYLNDAEYNTKSDKKKIDENILVIVSCGSQRRIKRIVTQLADAMDELFAMDLYSTAREPAIKQLQKESERLDRGDIAPSGSDGTSVRKRSDLCEVNQLLGHFANNGLAL